MGFIKECLYPTRIDSSVEMVEFNPQYLKPQQMLVESSEIQNLGEFANFLIQWNTLQNQTTKVEFDYNVSHLSLNEADHRIVNSASLRLFGFTSVINVVASSAIYMLIPTTMTILTSTALVQVFSVACQIINRNEQFSLLQQKKVTQVIEKLNSERLQRIAALIEDMKKTIEFHKNDATKATQVASLEKIMKKFVVITNQVNINIKNVENSDSDSFDEL